MSSCTQSFSCLSFLLPFLNVAFLGWDHSSPKSCDRIWKTKEQNTKSSEPGTLTGHAQTNPMVLGSPALPCCQRLSSWLWIFAHHFDYLSFSMWLACHWFHDTAGPISWILIVSPPWRVLNCALWYGTYWTVPAVTTSAVQGFVVISVIDWT